jgi:redox-sensitive bicupin YhaK (pirin superfamily)
MSIRPVKRVTQARPTREGAGVHLHRAFGFGDTAETDPFLLFDDFRGDTPAHYQAGFPWHPHRGIETITYVLAGTVAHADSLGNRGTLGAGDVQWMTAGRGIIHHEMPAGAPDGRMHGFQLWANLPGALKMTAPRYQEVPSGAIAEVTDDNGTHVRVICGTFWGRRGPVDGIAADPVYLDVTVPAGVRTRLPVDAYRSTFAYVFEGSGQFRDASPNRGILTERTAGNDDDLVRDLSGNRSLLVFDTGDEVVVTAGPHGVRFLLVAGAPIREPVAWHGPIVMNTRAELQQALHELHEGTFIRP